MFKSYNKILKNDNGFIPLLLLQALSVLNASNNFIESISW